MVRLKIVELDATSGLNFTNFLPTSSFCDSKFILILLTKVIERRAMFLNRGAAAHQGAVKGS